MKTIRIAVPGGAYVFELVLLRHDNAVIRKCSKVCLYSKVLNEEKAREAYSILRCLLESDSEENFNTRLLSDEQLDFLRENLTDSINGTNILSFRLLFIKGGIEIVEP